MYYTSISYMYPSNKWKVYTLKINVLEETDDYYVVEESEGVHIRSDIVYKNDKDDVACDGYTVLNYPRYGDVDLIEGYSGCVSLTKEEGIKIVKEALAKTLSKKIDFFNEKLENLNDIK